MNKFQFFVNNKTPKILCLGAHADDIEIGCGGTILKIATEYPKAEFRWIVFTAEGKRAKEAHQSANSFLTDIESKVIDVQAFKDSYFPFVGAAIKDYFVNLKKEFSPDLVLTHYSNDAHQDHQLIAKLTWNAFRDNLILEYEIAKYDADLGIPNLYVHLNESLVQRKITNICEIFQSQIEKEWFGEEAFRSIMRIRGIESNSPSKYAEAFYCRKIVV
jgi:LmbE family N-acetylglucosaminyl deacetylase